MKIAFFTDTYLPQINGVAKTLSRLSCYLDENNIEYRIFAPSFKETDIYQNVLRSKSIKLILYPQCRLSFPNYFSISKELDYFSPDLVHSITEFNMGLCGLRYAKTHSISLVTSYETNITQYLEYYKLKFLEQPSWKYLKWFHGKSDRVFCPSQASIKLLAKEGFKNIDLWERGIEFQKFSPEFRDTDFMKSLGINNKIVFTYVGRVSPEKDLPIFIKVSKMLNEKYKSRIHFVIVGDGPCLKELKDTSPDNITFTGFMSGTQLSKIYASSDVFLFPSPTETLGFVVLEAMSSGIAVIACNVGGISENLIDGFNGLACREKNELDFFLAAEKLILNEDYRQTLSRNARKYALEKSWNRTFDKLLLSYSNVLSNKEKLSLTNCS